MWDNGFDEWRERYLDWRRGQLDKSDQPAELEISEQFDSRALKVASVQVPGQSLSNTANLILERPPKDLAPKGTLKLKIEPGSVYSQKDFNPSNKLEDHFYGPKKKSELPKQPV